MEVFNQYYFEVLKKVRDIARREKQTSKQAREVLRSIKCNYLSWDKLSPEYHEWFTSNSAWQEYASLENDKLNEWLVEHGDAEVYKSINLKTICGLLRDDYIVNHFVTVIHMLSASDANADLIKDPDENSDNFLIRRLAYLNKSRTVAETPSILKGIEETTLGKLAKEIMDEIDMTKLQESMGSGDILQNLAKPDNGFASLLGTVSQKMIAKMASGELKQETLLQDAMKIAGNLTGGGGGGGGLDMLTKLMSGMGGGGGLSEMMRGMGMGGGGGAASSKRRRMKKLRRKMAAQNINSDISSST